MNTGGHLAVRAPGDPGALALSTAVVEAALESARWSAVTVLAERSVAELFAGLPWAERVRAVDGDGEGTAWRAVAPQAATGGIAVPEGLLATAGVDEIRLTWFNSTDADILGYN
ncbi:MAG: hypothetical protein QF410_06030, partial [Planctomycetota bacterium]|nr:hypothetical protein [Planctomycetota bacterium]